MGILLAEIVIPKMFSSVQGVIIESDSPYESAQLYGHYCSACEQVFTAKWGYRTNMGMQLWLGNSYHCPRCSAIVSAHKGFIREVGGSAPINMTLRLYEYKDTVTLKIRYDSVQFTADGSGARIFSCTESVTFDVKRRVSQFMDRCGDVYTFDNPFDNGLLEKSALAALTHNSFAWADNKKDLNRLLLKLREAIAKKSKAFHGRSIRALFVPAGSSMGALLFPLQNIAWRISIPDAPNIDSNFNSKYVRQGYNFKNFLSDNNFRFDDAKKFFDNVILLARQGLSYPQSVLRAADLPDAKAFRKIISKGRLLEIGRLHTAYKMTPNYDEQLAIYRFLSTKQALPSNTWRTTVACYPYVSELVIDFTAQVAKVYGEGAIFRMMISQGLSTLEDCARTFRKLWALDKKLFMSEKPRIRDIHDWLVRQWNKRKTEDFPLGVPEHIVKRLAMQRDRLKFFMPETAYALKDAGIKMHNCVGTYDEKVLDGLCVIVVVADDRGKMKACLEVSHNTIIQAKDYENKPVARWPKLNKNILDWAKDAKLKINTLDIDSRSSDKELRNAI